jgi:hypothetical protein
LTAKEAVSESSMQEIRAATIPLGSQIISIGNG